MDKGRHKLEVPIGRQSTEIRDKDCGLSADDSFLVSTMTNQTISDNCWRLLLGAALEGSVFLFTYFTPPTHLFLVIILGWLDGIERRE